MQFNIVFVGQRSKKWVESENFEQINTSSAGFVHLLVGYLRGSLSRESIAHTIALLTSYILVVMYMMLVRHRAEQWPNRWQHSSICSAIHVRPYIGVDCQKQVLSKSFSQLFLSKQFESNVVLVQYWPTVADCVPIAQWTITSHNSLRVAFTPIESNQPISARLDAYTAICGHHLIQSDSDTDAEEVLANQTDFRLLFTCQTIKTHFSYIL